MLFAEVYIKGMSTHKTLIYMRIGDIERDNMSADVLYREAGRGTEMPCLEMARAGRRVCVEAFPSRHA